MHQLRVATTAFIILFSHAALFAQSNWISATDMSSTRQRHSATLLSDGRLLISGGALDFWGEVASATCEIYDPATEAWSSAGAMTVARSSHTSTLLPNGKVLVTGGYNGGGYALSSAEIYDPVTDQWTSTTSMTYGRYRHQAVVLNADSILIIGGRQGNVDGHGVMNIWAPVSTCEIYRISDGLMLAAAPMNETRVESGIALLPDGRVLVAGGINDTLVISDWGQPASKTCEIYDPVVDTWSYTDSLQSPRNFVRLVTLDDNHVLSVGGEFDQYALYDSEIYNVYTGTWNLTDSMSSPRIVTEVVKLPGGGVMSIGGWSYLWSSQTNTAEYFTPETTNWNTVESMSIDRGWHTATMLDNGDILVAGGTSSRGNALASCEIYRVNSLSTFSIAAVGDAPSDEGGFVRVFWNPHPQDVRGASAVSGYSVYVRDDQGTQLEGTDGGTWKVVASTDARGLRRYALNVPSPETSSSEVRRTREYVVAAIRGTSVLRVTPSVTGSAFDNKGPAQVKTLRAVPENSRALLTWQGPASTDVDHYEVFRGTSPDFVMNATTLIGTSTTSTLQAPTSEGYFRVRAVDRASNAGVPSAPVTLDGINASPGTDGVRSISIGSAHPIPAADMLVVPVTSSQSCRASIRIVDALSREVATLSSYALAPGMNAVRIDVSGVAPGSYLCFIAIDGKLHSTRFVVAR